CLELTLRPIAHFAQVPLAKRTISYPTRNLLNALDIGLPAHELDEQREDRRVFVYRFGSILLGQGAGKVPGILLQLGAQRFLLALELPQGFEIGIHLVPRNRDLAPKDVSHPPLPFRASISPEASKVMIVRYTVSLYAVGPDTIKPKEVADKAAQLCRELKGELRLPFFMPASRPYTRPTTGTAIPCP